MAPGNLWNGWAEGLTLGVDAAQLLLDTPPVPCEGGFLPPIRLAGGKRVGLINFYSALPPEKGFPGSSVGKESAWILYQYRRARFDPWVGKIPWRREWQPTPVSLPGKSHGQGAWWATVHGVTKSQARLSNSGLRFPSPRAACRGALSSSFSSRLPRDRGGDVEGVRVIAASLLGGTAGAMDDTLRVQREFRSPQCQPDTCDERARSSDPEGLR